MAAVTDDEFETLLDEEMGWRRIELQALATRLQSEANTNPTSPIARALTRSMSTLLYAHWEGYCKAVFEAYMKLILKRKPLVCDAADSLAVAHIQQLLRRIESGDSAATDSLLSMVRGKSSERIRLNSEKIVDTKSNLRYRVLSDIMRSLNIPIDEFELKRNLIDVQLCDARNEIAHGRASFPPANEVLALHINVVEMMESMRDLSIGQVRTKRYSWQA
ncbi:MAE_28990/MAE_18760 family HEPN-like nuclease [Tsukamurella strandjordii]|uniref:MAE_28990/MAE_18760 family HEPN-like nuclease n=1 Tax=Tsukamurella strandjordii TaxID=147577 RepID=A0AA90ND89_9ACTN|nr:MAE_28990/MAE_18760 family HEPN-like nuclease [Tsukamurella strandjordii]MDP0400382.1 MAE_28990/MAE_18760 family HEPN-like nuclease [Tsukamurella strandjordii]